MGRGRTIGAWIGVGVAVLGLAAGVVAVAFPELVELVLHGESRDLRPERSARSALTDRRPRLLVLALDGVDRDLLYGALRAGELPNLAHLLGGRTAGEFPRAHFEDRVLSTMPSSTIPAWASLFTGLPPARHGITGNEFFVRERRAFAALAPVSFEDSAPTMAIYTDDAADALLRVPTIFEQMRADDPGVEIWVSMGQFHRGADRLLMGKRSILADAFRDFVEDAVADGDARDVYAELDEEVLETLTDALEDDGVPDVLTIYLAGIDLHAHQAPAGPDAARSGYLREVLDPALGALVEALERARALDDRYVVVVSEHGHTEVESDDVHALGAEADDELPSLLRQAGFRVRPAALEVDDAHDFQAVVAYGGATAYVYLADRSSCPEPGQRCDFTRPPRFEEDVRPVAEAIVASTRTGRPIAGLQGAIDLVLTRRPRPLGADAAPFEVYLGDGRLEDVERHLARRGEAHYVETGPRLHELAAGPLGERAGDIMLITRNGGEPTPATRFYFSATSQSWHGSPSRKDSEVPLIVAHRRLDRADVARRVDGLLGPWPRPHDVGRLLVALRRDTASP